MAKTFADLPQSESYRLIDFDDVDVRPGFIPNTFILIVSGTKPYINMKVELAPRVYVKQPDYWGIEVVGSLPGVGLPAEAPYTAAIPLDGITGTEGIEVIGATKSKRVSVGSGIKHNLALNALVDLKIKPPGLYVHGSIIVDRPDDKVEVKKAVPQGIIPAVLLLELKVMRGSAPLKDTPHHFTYEEHGEHVETYKEVSVRYGEGGFETVEVKVLG